MTRDLHGSGPEQGPAVSNILKQENGLIEYHTFPGTGKVLQTNIPHKMSNLPLSLKDILPPPVLESIPWTS